MTLAKYPIKVALTMLGRPLFDMPLAEEYFDKIKIALQNMGVTVEYLENPLTAVEEVSTVSEKIRDMDLDALVVVQGTFTDASLILTLANSINLPLLIWGVREKSSGGRLRLNSLCGLNLGANALVAGGRKFKAVYGDLETGKPLNDALSFLRAAGAAKWLKGKRIGIIGHRPLGYYSSNFNEVNLYANLGVTVVYVPTANVFNLANKIEMVDFSNIIGNLTGYNEVDAEMAKKSLRAYLALKEIVASTSLDAVAVQCWPDFKSLYGGEPCFSLSQLNDDGVIAACEADVNGAVTMLLGQYWSGKATFFADLVESDEDTNELTFWHCGAAPRSLIAKNDQPVAAVHPNRGIPLCVYFPLSEGRVTISRISPGEDGRLRLLLGCGTGLQTPLLYNGNTLLVKMEKPVGEIINKIFNLGFEHHYTLAYGDFTKELREFSKLVNLELVEIM